jgi:RNA polymerase sigma-70 factor (ECF subfamily)
MLAVRSARAHAADQSGDAERLEQVVLAAEEVAKINPHIVYVHCVGYGSDGPYAGRQAFDDLVQAAVIRVIRIVERQTGDGEGDPPFASSYLYKVAHSALVDEIRRVRRRRETDLDDEGVAPVAVMRQDPERITASREIGRGIVECLSRMTRERRMAVTLYLQGHSVADAARVLEWPFKRTENLVYRGLADLRECLMAKGMRA